MNLSIRAIVFAIASFALTTSSFAVAPKEKLIYEGDIKAEQRVATATIADATNDLDHASKAFSRQTYKYAWIYLTDCGVKLDQTKSKLKDHPARIQVARQVLFNMNLSADARAKLSKSYYKVKEDLDHAYVLMNALEGDLGKALGIDVATVRKYMSALQILCEETKEAKYCEAYARLKALVDSGDVAGIAKAIKSMAPLLDELSGDAARLGIDVEVPTSTNITTSAPASSNISAASQNIISAIDSSDPRSGEYIHAVGALDSAANSGDQSAIARRNAIAKISADCQRGVPGACEKLKQMLGKLVDCQNGDPSACDQLDAIVNSILNTGSSSASGYGKKSGIPSGAVPVTVNGQEVTFIDGTGVSTVYIGGKGMLLRKETVLKLVDMNANPPYQEVSSKDWNFVIQNSQSQATATGCIYHFTLVEQNGREDFRVKSWTVTGPDGSILKSGSESPFDVTFNAAGSYDVEIKGATTELGSDFTIRSTVEVSF